MKIGLVSDSHGQLDALKQAVDRMGDVDIIFHMGDYISDAETIRQMKSVPVLAVQGNMDAYSGIGELEILTETGGKKILVCHGHRYHVKSEYSTLRYKALEVGADMVFFGHTHRAMIDQDEMLLMINPGSCALPHIGCEPSYGIVEIDEDGNVKADIFTF